jgi:hypothetical protein
LCQKILSYTGNSNEKAKKKRKNSQTVIKAQCAIRTTLDVAGPRVFEFLCIKLNILAGG